MMDFHQKKKPQQSSSTSTRTCVCTYYVLYNTYISILEGRKKHEGEIVHVLAADYNSYDLDTRIKKSIRRWNFFFFLSYIPFLFSRSE